MKITQVLRAVVDRDVTDSIGEFDLRGFANELHDFGFRQRLQESYLEAHSEWIRLSKLNRIEGLDAFPHRYLISGATQAIDEFHWLHANKRLRLHVGEYFYHYRVLGDAITAVEEEPLEHGDALVLSTPLSVSGKKHPEFDRVLESCSDLNIPVMLDCAYFGACTDLDVKVDYRCVESVCFSLSKCFGMGNMRAGILFSRNDKGHIKVQNDFSYTNLLPAAIGIHLMEKFSPDYIFDKYRRCQLELCQDLDIKPTNIVTVGVGDKPFHPNWVRSSHWGYRYGLAEELMTRIAAN